MKLPSDIEKTKNDLDLRDIHWRKECDELGWKCGAHLSWQKGFDAGVKAAFESEAVKGLIAELIYMTSDFARDNQDYRETSQQASLSLTR